MGAFLKSYAHAFCTAPWGHIMPHVRKKTEREEVIFFVSYSRFKTFLFHWEIFYSIVSMYPYERGSVSTVVFHLFVVRVPERLRSTQQPAALTARRLLECNQPCTERRCHVALKERKALNVGVKPTLIYQSRRRSLLAMQPIHAAISLISKRKKASARSWFLRHRKRETTVK